MNVDLKLFWAFLQAETSSGSFRLVENLFYFLETKYVPGVLNLNNESTLWNKDSVRTEDTEHSHPSKGNFKMFVEFHL
jgi:hypothetical protein